MRRWPAAAAIRADTRSGATALAARAGAALRALAAEAEAAGRLDGALLAGAARALVRAQPAMAPLVHLGSAVLAATGDTPTARAVAEAVVAFEAQAAADAAAVVARGADLVPDGGCVLTLSASSLVERALLVARAEGRAFRVVCLESRPQREGTALAARLARAGLTVELWIDAAAAACLPRAGLALVGADTVAPAGLIHKIGTRGLALVAHHDGVPLYALAGATKLLPTPVAGALSQRRPAGQVLRGARGSVAVQNYYYDRTALDLLAGVVLADELLPPEGAAAVASAVRVRPALSSVLDEG